MGDGRLPPDHQGPGWLLYLSIITNGGTRPIRVVNGGRRDNERVRYETLGNDLSPMAVVRGREAGRSAISAFQLTVVTGWGEVRYASA